MDQVLDGRTAPQCGRAEGAVRRNRHRDRGVLAAPDAQGTATVLSTVAPSRPGQPGGVIEENVLRTSHTRCVTRPVMELPSLRLFVLE